MRLEMASTRMGSHVEWEHMDTARLVCLEDALGDQPSSSRSEHKRDIPDALSTAPVLEASSRLQFLATWLLGYLRYTCGVLGYFAACLPSTQMEQCLEECNVNNNDMDQERDVLIVDSSNVDDSDHRLESKHKVFLSHSGARKDFVEQLCVDLNRCDRYPFFDKLRSSPPIGEKFRKLIFDAIKQCQVGVVFVLEEFFMRSKWPMVELNAMILRDKMEEVALDSKVPIIVLYGTGGIGKTTISKALCNELSPKFCGNVCHIELGNASEMVLLRKVLKIFTYVRHDVLDDLDDVGQGWAYLKNKFYSRPIFLVVDNVRVDFKSMEVAQKILRVGYECGSALLFIARTLDVLKKLNLKEGSCLEMPELEEDEAQSLFLTYVGLPLVHEVDKMFIKDCIEQCHFLKGDGKSRHYHPLALKVLGQQLGCNPSL